jgi:hypothetical protein
MEQGALRLAGGYQRRLKEKAIFYSPFPISHFSSAEDELSTAGSS